MLHRQYPECNGELVLARRPDHQPGAGFLSGPSTHWRCSIRGLAFTAEQIREEKQRTKATSSKQRLGGNMTAEEIIEREPSMRKWAPRGVFVSAQAIRAGWSMLIFLAILIAEVLLTRVPVNRLLHSIHDKPALQVWSAVLGAGIPALLVLVATAIMAKIEKQPVLSYGFMGEHKLSRFVTGIAGGV